LVGFGHAFDMCGSRVQPFVPIAVLPFHAVGQARTQQLLMDFFGAKLGVGGYYPVIDDFAGLRRYAK
jgi:hypothetical protein